MPIEPVSGPLYVRRPFRTADAFDLILNGFLPVARLRSAFPFLFVRSGARKFRVFYFCGKISASPCRAFTIATHIYN